MKKIFILLGLVAFSAASAQQNDLFDINSHIQKKQVEWEKSKKNKELSKLLKLTPSFKIYNSQKLELSYTLANGDRVFQSPAYNMPCIIPDMRKFQIMANGSVNDKNKDYCPVRIPNPATPFEIERTIVLGKK